MLVNSLLSLAGLASLTLAAPLHDTLQARQTSAECSVYATGYLGVRPTDGPDDRRPFINVGIVNNVTEKGITGKNDSLLVTKDQNGDLLLPQLWEFARCKSLDKHANSPSYNYTAAQATAKDNATHHYYHDRHNATKSYFGILRPKGSYKHCLSLATQKVRAAGSNTTLLDSNCNVIPAQYRTWQFVETYDSNINGTYTLYNADNNFKAVIANGTYGEVEFFSYVKNTTRVAMDLVLDVAE